MSAATRFAGTTGHPVGETKTNLAVGMDKGRQLTKIALKPKPSYRKGVRVGASPRLPCSPLVRLAPKARVDSTVWRSAPTLRGAPPLSAGRSLPAPALMTACFRM